MSAPVFVSYAQNGEDVVLWRALHAVTHGRYVDVGASHPVHDSVTKAFAERGWTGVNVEPMAAQIARLEADRPDDVNIRAAVTSADIDEIVLHEVADTGLSTLEDDVAELHQQAGFPVTDVRVPTTRLDAVLTAHVPDPAGLHFLKIDVEGAEADVLATVDLRTWRPWVLVVEATAPNSVEQTHAEWEPGVLASGYRFCLFDGISRYYVAEEHAELIPALSYPACTLDRYVRFNETVLERNGQQARAERDQLLTEVIRWRGLAMQSWAEATGRRDDYDRLASEVGRLTDVAANAGHAAALANAELVKVRQTLSWRVTKPLRAARRISPTTGAR